MAGKVNYYMLLGKCFVGVGSSWLAAIFSSGWDEIFKELAVIFGILVSVLTTLNLMWELTDKIHSTIRRQKSSPLGTVSAVIPMANNMGAVIEMAKVEKPEVKIEEKK